MFQNVGESVLKALNESLIATANFLPNLLVAIIVFIVGVVLGTILRGVLVRILDTLNFESALASTGIPAALKRTETNLTVTRLLGELLRWFVILIFLIPAIDRLGLSAAKEVLTSLWFYIPQVVVAVIIVAVGAIVAKIARDFVTATATGLGGQMAQIVGEVARWSIVIFSILAALNQLGVATDLIKILFTGFVVMVAIAGGLAFGLGGKDTAERLLKRFFDRVVGP